MTKTVTTRTLWIVGLLVLVVIISRWRASRPPAEPTSKGVGLNRSISDADALAFIRLDERERSFGTGVWRDEILAQQCENRFLDLWNQLNQVKPSDNGLLLLSSLPIPRIQMPRNRDYNRLDQGIEIWHWHTNKSGGIATSDYTETNSLLVLSHLAQIGWKLDRTSWKLVNFRPGRENKQTTSEGILEVRATMNHPQLNSKAVVKTRLKFSWKSELNSQATPASELGEAFSNFQILDLEVTRRAGRPGAIEVFSKEFHPPEYGLFVDPLLAADLDQDGRSEILLPGAKLGLKMRGETFQEFLLDLPFMSRICAAVAIDQDQDGWLDLLVATDQGLFLAQNNKSGVLVPNTTPLWKPSTPLKHAQVLSAADIDGDGDLDLWLGQYKLPYQGGQFPTPYFDANDGFPSYLLRNDGPGKHQFTDVTAPAGLSSKRHRRTYAASFADIDNDRDQDLILTSDFAGLDVFLNTGTGVFQDVTTQFMDDRHLFGMGHAIMDINHDGLMDFLALGMTSATASRLDSLNIDRPFGNQLFPKSKRASMSYGNRLFLGVEGLLRFSNLSEQIRDSGWSWGVTVMDFDNNGLPDIAISNGHETRPNVLDYERQFWLHDLYVANSTNDPIANFYFGAANAQRARDQASYGGWQDNVLFLSFHQSNTATAHRFLEAAYLFGLALPEDSQNLISDDFNGDGKLDLACISFTSWPQRVPKLQILENRLETRGNWIGIKLRPTRKLLPGTRIDLHTEAGSVTSKWIVTGDSYRSQHSASAHFG